MQHDHNFSYSEWESPSQLFFIYKHECLASFCNYRETCQMRVISENEWLTDSIYKFTSCENEFSVILVCDACQCTLCGVGCITGGSGFIMGPSLWALALRQKPQMPLTACWFSRWSLEVAVEDRGCIGAGINHRSWLLWLMFYISTMGSGSCTKMRYFFNSA